MNITVTLNGTVRTAEVRPDTTLFDFLREQGCYSVKCGMRDLQLRALHRPSGRTSGALLQFAGSPGRWSYH